MSTTVKAPRLGEGVDELAIGKWLVAVGAVIEENQPLVELESDKVVTELVSPAAGILLKILVREGDIVRVGDAVALIGAASEAGAEGPGVPGTEPRTSARAAEAGSSRGIYSGTSGAAGRTAGAEARSPSEFDPEPRRLFLSPLARKLCALHDVDPTAVRGTGLGGRVMKQDILDFVAARESTGAPDRGAVLRTGEFRPHSNARSRIAVRMVESLRAAAQVLTVMEADLGAVMAHRRANKDRFAKEGVRLTLTAYFLAATAAALRRHPTVNSSWSDEGLYVHPSVDIGLAVSLGEEGLLVPVVRKADTLSLEELARTVEDLATRSRSRKLRPDEVRGGTFSLTNHGSSGSLFATPILVQPQVGILGVGKVQKRAVVVESDGSDAIAIRPMAYLSFVFDHRVMDGEGADRFLAEVKAGLEGWQ